MSYGSLLTKGGDVGRRRGNKASFHVTFFVCVIVRIWGLGTFVPGDFVSTITRDPDIGHILKRQEQKSDATYTRLVDTLFTRMLDDRFAKLNDRFAELTSSMDSQVESMTHLEDRLLAKIDAFNGQIGDLRMDTLDHERRLNDHDQRIDDLTSNLLKLESLHKGYKDRTTALVDTLRRDVNDTRAKLPDLRREVQDSAAELRREYHDATDGLATSINNLAAHISTLHQ